MIQFEEFLRTSSPQEMLTWPEGLDPGTVIGQAANCAACPVTQWFKLNGFDARTGIHIAFLGPSSKHVTLPPWLDKVVDGVDAIWAGRERAWRFHHWNEIGWHLSDEQFKEFSGLRDITAKDLVGVLKWIIEEKFNEEIKSLKGGGA